MSAQIIGIVGGMGMAAGIQLESLIVKELERCKVPESSYPPIFSLHNAQIPDRSAFLFGHAPNPAPMISDAMNTLGELGAQIIAIPCNTSHSAAILGEVDSKYQSNLLNIVDVVVKKLDSRVKKGQRVGLMATQGTYTSGVYKKAIDNAGYKYIEPSKQSKAKIMKAIYDIKLQGQSTNTDKVLEVEFKNLSAKSEIIILGCTELSLSSLTNEPKAVDSLFELARALVKTSV